MKNLTLQNKEYRSNLFNYLDGIAILSTLNTLLKRNILDFINKNPFVEFSEICKKNNANPGYLNVAFRLFKSQGFLNRQNYIDGQNYKISITNSGKKLLKYSTLIDQFSGIILKLENPENAIQNPIGFDTLKLLNDLKSIENNRLLNILISSVIGPIFVANGMNVLNIVNQNKSQIEFDCNEIHNDWQRFITELFEISNIIKSKQDVSLTDFGEFIAKRSSAFGVTVSYLPLLNRVDELIFSNPNIAHERNENGLELHVDRTMNVWGSGGAHRVYFKKIDEIIKDIFNQPLENQPKGIADMGCGNGEFLKHLFNIVKNETLRGQHLNKFPLLIIGADFNHAALESSKKTLSNAGINHFLVQGNIGDPDEFAARLKLEKIDLSSCLNVRSFLDHNRLLDFPLSTNEKFVSNQIRGSFVFKGQWISGNEVITDFVNHIQKWKPYIQKYGIILLELHTISSTIANQTLGQNASTAYDATHGYSDQYIIDFKSFKIGIQYSGLKIDEKNSIQFPNTQNPLVSISYIL